MKPYQILKTLLPDNLEPLENASNEFWHGCFHGCNADTKYPFKFKVSDPMQFGNGIPDNIFPKIIDGMINGTLSENDFAIALGKFSIHCTKEEWSNWFKPILSKTLELPISNAQFNKYAPKEYQFESIVEREVIPLTEVSSIPSKFFFEPYYDLPIYYWHVNASGANIVDKDREPFEHSATESISKLNEMFNNTIILIGVLEDDIWIFKDIMTSGQFHGEQPTLPLEYRLQILADFHQRVLAPRDGRFTIADVYKGTTDASESKTTRTSFNLLIEQGYRRVLIRGADDTYYEGHDILIDPTRKSVLTCTDITTGDRMMKEVAEYVHGRGRIDKKSFTTPVYHGLTFDLRTDMVKNKDSLIGKRFDVVSCGLGSDGKLVFPIFDGWK